MNFFSVLLLLSYLSLTDGAYVTIDLDQNGQKLRGQEITVKGVKLAKFSAVPFAEPPVGSLRFEAPQPFPRWNGTRDALRFSNECMQRIVTRKSESEDCLHLEIYSPDVNGSLPVFVYIHGGAFRAGGSDYDISPMAVKGLVVVRMHYRLGALGFMSTGDSEMPGNYGLLDQIEGLKWIQKYIKSFGGDPLLVTLFGQSAGAASISALRFSPLAKGLFKRVILDSGSALALWGLERPGMRLRNKNITREIGSILRCSQSNSSLLLACLKQANSVSLTRAYNYITNYHGLTVSLPPRVEKYFGFLLDFPSNLLERGEFNKVDTMIGYDSGEWSPFIMDPSDVGFTTRGFHKTFTRLMTTVQAYLLPKSVVDAVTKIYVKNYTNSYKLREALIDSTRDLLFSAPSMLELNGLIKKSNNTNYLFEYNYQQHTNFYPAWMKAAHGSELKSIFFQDSQMHTQEDRDMADKMQTLLKNFAKYGNPTATKILENGQELKWEPYTQSNPVMLKLDSTSKITRFPNQPVLSLYSQMLRNVKNNTAS